MPPAPASHIAAVEALGRTLDSAEVEHLAGWLGLVQDAGRVMNLTGLDSPQEMAAELVGEALRLQDIGAIQEGTEVLDIGSGNGSPLFPLAILNPQCSFSAVESRQRRADFLRFAAARLKLRNIRVICARVEDLPPAQRGPYGLVTSRAFAAPAMFIGIALGLLGDSGEIRGLGGAGAADEVRQSVAGQGLKLISMESYTHADRERCVYRLGKNSESEHT